MRFKKGIHVEVMEEELPYGSWRPGRIVEGNGRNYVVRYDNFSQDASSFVKVPRRFLRPRPPPIVKRSCVPGEVVEIFENSSWKPAQFLGTLERSVIVVKAIGSSTEVQVHRSQMRMPCTWKKDNSWIEFSMESGKPNTAVMNSQSRAGNLSYHIPQSCLDVQAGDDLLPEKYEVYAEQQYQCAGTTKKRKGANIIPGVLPKNRTKLKENKRFYKLNVQHLSTQKLEKVDDVDSQQNIYAGMCMHGAVGNGRAKFIENGMSMENQIVDTGHDIKEHLDYSGDESITSSVGSCSVASASHRSVHYKASQSKIVCAHFDDADSFTDMLEEACIAAKGKIFPRNSKFELDAYHSTMRSFYESGSLSWEKETFLTNLRLSLNITNDEHLMVLKQLRHSRR